MDVDGIRARSGWCAWAPGMVYVRAGGEFLGIGEK